MRQIHSLILIAATFLAASFLDADVHAQFPPCATPSFTHSASPEVIELNSIACNEGAPDFVTGDNSYWRSFDLEDFPIDPGTQLILAVEIGIQTSEPGPGFDTQPMTLRLYDDLDANPAPVSQLTLLAEQSYELPFFDDELACFPLDTPLDVSSVTRLVVEIAIPDATGGEEHVFFIGTNDLGETEPSYISSVGCGQAEPATFESLDFPGRHVVMNVHYGTPGSADSDVLRGDADGDGSFSGIQDGLFILTFGFVPGSPVPPCLAACDADGNDIFVAIQDGLHVLNFAFIPGSPPIPAPFPDCGPAASTISALGCDIATCP